MTLIILPSLRPVFFVTSQSTISSSIASFKLVLSMYISSSSDNITKPKPFLLTDKGPIFNEGQFFNKIYFSFLVKKTLYSLINFDIPVANTY